MFISPKRKKTVLKMSLKSSIMSKLDHQMSKMNCFSKKRRFLVLKMPNLKNSKNPHINRHQLWPIRDQSCIWTYILWKQAWKLSAIKGEPNLSILWEVRQIHLKKAFSSQKATSNLTQVFLDKMQFLQKSHYCLLGPSRSF